MTGRFASASGEVPAPTAAIGFGRVLRRQLRRVTNRLWPPRVRFVYDPRYEASLSGVPMDPLRADRILAFLCAERLIRRDEIETPRPVTIRNLLLVHGAEYLERLQRPETLTSVLGLTVRDEELDATLDLQRLMVGGTIQATRIALATRHVAIHLGGGFHHALPDRGMGFCVFNDVAVAITRLRARGFDQRILVVDLDLHDGNGTRAIFADDPSVHTFSIHNQSWGEGGAREATTLPLGPAIGDETFLAVLTRELNRVADRFRPALVIYLAGCDGAADDAIGDWELTAEGIFARDRFVTAIAEGCGAALAVVLAGGYGDGAWRYSARFAAWLLARAPIEPPSNEDLTLLRFRQIKATLDPAHLTGAADLLGWALTEEDLAGILPGIPKQTRFLDYFSRVGIELMLERFGILSQIRGRGFRQPSIQLELDHPLGQTLRIFGDRDRQELLVELRLARSRRTAPGFEVLVIEWLLLQNPRSSFDERRRRLPGQQHPGLGLLREIFGFLVVICETIELDGVVFSPSHLHVAAVSHPHARFLNPEREALLRGLEDLFAGVALDEASRIVESGGVIDRIGKRPILWEGGGMVVPASTAMRAAVGSESYEEAVAEARAALDLALRGTEAEKRT